MAGLLEKVGESIFLRPCTGSRAGALTGRKLGWRGTAVVTAFVTPGCSAAPSPAHISGAELVVTVLALVAGKLGEDELADWFRRHLGAG